MNHKQKLPIQFRAARRNGYRQAKLYMHSETMLCFGAHLASTWVVLPNAMVLCLSRQRHMQQSAGRETTCGALVSRPLDRRAPKTQTSLKSWRMAETPPLPLLQDHQPGRLLIRLWQLRQQQQMQHAIPYRKDSPGMKAELVRRLGQQANMVVHAAAQTSLT